MKYLLFFVTLGFVAGFTVAASAGCMSGCLEEHGCDIERQADQGAGPNNACLTFHDTCEEHCNHSEESYGAVAYGRKSGAWGMSGSFDNKKAAREDALSYCRQNGNDCKIVMDLFESCAAVAEGDNDVVTWGNDATAAGAQTEALAACTKKAGSGCEVELWRCYYP